MSTTEKVRRLSISMFVQGDKKKYEVVRLRIAWEYIESLVCVGQAFLLNKMKLV